MTHLVATEAQIESIRLIIEGVNKTKIAKILDIDRRTLTRWMRDSRWLDAYRVEVEAAEEHLTDIPIASRRLRLARLQADLDDIDDIDTEGDNTARLRIAVAAGRILEQARVEMSFTAGLPRASNEIAADFWADDTRSEPQKLADFLDEVESLARQWEALGFTVEAFLARLRRLLPKELSEGLSE
jgi:hypothetical protein